MLDSITRVPYHHQPSHHSHRNIITILRILRLNSPLVRFRPQIPALLSHVSEGWPFIDIRLGLCNVVEIYELIPAIADLWWASLAKQSKRY